MNFQTWKNEPFEINSFDLLNGNSKRKRNFMKFNKSYQKQLPIILLHIIIPCIAKHSKYFSKIGITRCDSAKIRVRIIVTNASNDTVDMHIINMQTRNLQKMKSSKMLIQMFLFQNFRRKWKIVRQSFSSTRKKQQTFSGISNHDLK